MSKIFALGAICLVLAAPTSFALTKEEQILLDNLQAKAAAEAAGLRRSTPPASISTKEGSVLIKGKDVSFGITGLDDPITVNSIVENIAAGKTATTELTSVFEKCAVQNGDVCHGKTDPQLVTAFAALSEQAKQLDTKLAATTSELTATKTELANAKSERNQLASTINDAATKSADDIEKALQGQWTPLGAYRKFPAKDCAAIKTAMFDTGTGKYWVGANPKEAKPVVCDMSGAGTIAKDGTSKAMSAASCKAVHTMFSESYKVGVYWIKAVQVFCGFDSTGAPAKIGGDGSTAGASAPSCQGLLDGFGAAHLKTKKFVGGKQIMCKVSSDGKTATKPVSVGFGSLLLTKFGTSDRGDGGGKSLGSCASFSSDPKVANGKEIGRMVYTPTTAGELLIVGRPISIQETSNVMNDWRISAHLVSNGQLLGWCGCSWGHPLQNPNIGLLTLRIATPSWGVGKKDTVIFKMHADGSCQRTVFQYNTRYHPNYLPSPLLFTIEDSTRGNLVQMNGYIKKGWGSVAEHATHLGKPYAGSSQPVLAEGIEVHSFTMTVKESDSQLLFEGPPITMQEVSNIGDDYRIAVFDTSVDGDECLGWSGASYSYKQMKSNENIGFASLRVLTAKGKVKPGLHKFVVKVAATGGQGNHYQYNARYRRGWVQADVVFTVKEISSGEPDQDAMLQMKNYKKTNFGTKILRGGSKSMGPGMSMGSLPTYNAGMELTRMNFQPKSSESYLLIEGPPIPVQETQNVADDFWIAVFKSNGDRLGASGHSMSHENWNPQAGLLCLRVWVKSWGTSSDNLRVRVYTSGSSGNHYLYNTVNSANYENPPLTFTITEIKN